MAKQTQRTGRKPGFGSVRKLPSGRHQASYVGLDRIRYNAPMTYSTKTDANAWLRQQEALMLSGNWKPPKSLEAEKFSEYANAWIHQRKTSKGEPLRPKTLHGYRQQLAKGLNTFATDRLEDITPARVRAWHTRRAQEAATAAGAEARLLKAILNTAVEDGIITKNPVPAKLGRSSTGKKHRPPTMEELAIILSLIEPRYRLVILLAAYGGLRIGEIRALTRSDLTKHGERYEVAITKQAYRVNGEGWRVDKPKSAEGVRNVSLPATLTAEIENHLETYTGAFAKALLFPAEQKGQFFDKGFKTTWERAQLEAGIKGAVREHDLRAFAGTRYALAGATLRETMAFLGHSSTHAAMAYQHTAGREKELADRMPAIPEITQNNITKISDRKAATAKQ